MVVLTVFVTLVVVTDSIVVLEVSGKVVAMVEVGASIELVVSVTLVVVSSAMVVLEGS